MPLQLSPPILLFVVPVGTSSCATACLDPIVSSRLHSKGGRAVAHARESHPDGVLDRLSPGLLQVTCGRAILRTHSRCQFLNSPWRCRNNRQHTLLLANRGSDTNTYCWERVSLTTCRLQWACGSYPWICDIWSHNVVMLARYARQLHDT
jgi:hypothetical protein